MSDDIRIWKIDDSSKAATPVESTNRMETENLLEELLVRNPDMLMPGLTLVGRQTPTESGNLDLLGVDADGRLVVFELKRERLRRDAVAQIIDYCSWLESLTETELAEYIASHSGTNGVDKIDDFESWYGVRRRKQLVELRPARMVLVGLGADARAHRMVEFLAQRDVDISLSTFRGYKYGDRTLLARQVEGAVETPNIGPGRRLSEAERRKALDERARELGMDGLWQDAVKALSMAFDRTAKNAGITFSLPGITLPPQCQCLRLPFGSDRPTRWDTRDVLSGSGPRLSGEISGQEIDGPVQIREAAQRAGDEGSPGAMVLSAGQGEMGGKQGGAHRACERRA